MRIRARTPADVAPIGDLLMRQQPLTRYPLRNPLPFPVADFIARPGELASWVADLDGRVVGHVSVLSVGDTDIGGLWSEGTGQPIEELGAVSVLVVDHTVTGRGIGRALLDQAEGWLIAQRRTPVLEVLGAHGRAAALYRARGWTVIGTARPSWLPDDEEPVELMTLRTEV